MSAPPTPEVDQATFWNEDGGRRWVEHIDQLERMLAGLSAELVRAVAARPGEQVLDIGCGGGTTSAEYARAVGAEGAVLGVDISALILAVAERRFTTWDNLRFELGDASTHPFPAAAFDVIASRFGVMFFPEPVAAFTHLRGAARAGGRLCFMCWRLLDENPWMGAAAKAAFSVLPPPEKPAPGTPGPFSLGDPARVREVLTAAGFVDLQLEPVDQQITLGSVDEALDWLSRMGPAAAPLADATPPAREAALAAMRDELARHDTAAGVTMPAAAWVVHARAR